MDQRYDSSGTAGDCGLHSRYYSGRIRILQVHDRGGDPTGMLPPDAGPSETHSTGAKVQGTVGYIGLIYTN